MEKKLKINFILKGIAVFAFVAFCLLAILAGVTLPFVSNASTVDCAVVSVQSDCATASAESDTFNPLDFCIPLSQCNTTDTYYGFYITDSLWNFVRNYDYSQTSGLLPLFYLTFTNSTSPLYFVAGKTDNIAYLALTDMNNMIKYFEDNFNYSSFTPYIVYPQGFKLSNILEGVSSGTLWSTSFYVFTSVPYGLQTVTVTNYGFQSQFGNFDSLASSDFYVNLSTDIVLPDIFYQFTNNSTPINGWFLLGSGSNMSIYGLNLFDRFYYNGTEESGLFNCGFQLIKKSIPSTTMPPTYTIKGTLQFIVFDTLIWSADCDFDYNTDTKVESITNIRNGSFKVSSNYDKDMNVYKFTAPSDKLYLLNENYNKSYDTFRSFIVQQDYKNVRVPSDNALYLKGYQAASGDFYNNGYNDGVVAGEKSGYNKGFTAGDAQGYNRGVEVGGNYSFLGLFGAIFDAPIQAIFGGTTTLPAGTTITDKNGNTTTLLSSATVHRAGLLNFEVMGVNLSGFVLAMFSLSIIVVVIKFALAKK